jgi:hypothetical protein
MSKTSVSAVQGKMVFICGLHRSGTSLLHRCIGDHPKVSAFSNTGEPEDEGQHLQSVYPAAKEYGGPGKFGFDNAAHLTEESPLATEANAHRLLEEWAPHWDLSAPRLVEKSPPNLIRARFLQALFPGAAFVFLIRHPLTVSYATRKWSKTSLPELLEHWLVCHNLFRNDLPRVNRRFVARYEDFVREPESMLRRIHAFLRVESYPTTRTIRSDVNEKYIRRFERFGILRHAQHAYLRSRFERRILEYGYSLRRGNYVLDPPSFCARPAA